MGCGRFAGDGSSTEAMAWHLKRHPAERVSHGIFAGVGGGALCAADPGLALDVLDRRAAGAVHVVHLRESTGIGSMAATPQEA